MEVKCCNGGHFTNSILFESDLKQRGDKESATAPAAGMKAQNFNHDSLKANHCNHLLRLYFQKFHWSYGRSHREGDDLVEEHEWRHVEVEDEVLVVVGAVGALLDGGVLLLVAHAHAHHRVHVQPRQLTRLDDRDANLFINHKMRNYSKN